MQINCKYINVKADKTITFFFFKKTISAFEHYTMWQVLHVAVNETNKKKMIEPENHVQDQFYVHFSFDKASLWQVSFFEKFVQCRAEKFELILCLHKR